VRRHPPLINRAACRPAWRSTRNSHSLRILLVGQVIVAGTGSQLFLMTMTGCERGAATLLVLSAVLNAAASAALIGLFGLTGAAIASAATLIIWNLATALFLWRHLSLLPGVLASYRAPFREKATC